MPFIKERSVMPSKKSLCELGKSGILNKDFNRYKKLVRNGQVVCKNCGRVARKKKNICNLERLNPKEEGGW